MLGYTVGYRVGVSDGVNIIVGRVDDKAGVVGSLCKVVGKEVGRLLGPREGRNERKASRGGALGVSSDDGRSLGKLLKNVFVGRNVGCSLSLGNPVGVVDVSELGCGDTGMKEGCSLDASIRRKVGELEGLCEGNTAVGTTVRSLGG